MCNNRKIPVVAVVGPTASGKSALAVELAKYYDAEVLSFDSMQVYKGMDIATAKPTAYEMCGVPHHMIGVIDNTESFSVAKYKDHAEKIIDAIVSRGKRVIMVGGTGLYLDSVLQNIEFLPSEENREVRNQLNQALAEKGPDALFEELEKIDPVTAGKIDKSNLKRVLRALEVFYTTGHTMSYQVEQSKSVPSRYNPVYIGLNAKDREVLYGRINTRVDRMLEAGLVKEAEAFLKGDFGATARQAIGLKELTPFVLGEKSLAECTENLKRETRRYAKRQLTWFRRNENIHWLYIDEYPETEQQFGQAVRIIDKSGIFTEEV